MVVDSQTHVNVNEVIEVIEDIVVKEENEDCKAQQALGYKVLPALGYKERQAFRVILDQLEVHKVQLDYKDLQVVDRKVPQDCRVHKAIPDYKDRQALDRKVPLDCRAQQVFKELLAFDHKEPQDCKVQQEVQV
jgi:hypothetical protein